MNKILISTRLLSAILTVFLLLTMNLSAASAATDDPPLINLQILTVNDFHGSLVENGKNPGAAKIAQYIKEMKEKNPQGTLILSAGDMFQGSPDSNLLYGRTVVDVMNIIGFDAMAIGNHEFDWDIKVLKDRITQSKFPYLAANIIQNNTETSADFTKPYVFFELSGVKVALIGLTTPETAYKSTPKIVSPYTFTDPVTVVNDLVPRLKQQGADIIIVLCHMGSYMDKKTGEITGEAADLAMNTHGIDAIISAHSHQMVAGNVNNIPIVQAGYFGRALGTINLSFDKNTKQLLVARATTTPLPITELTEDLQVKAIIDKMQTEIAPIKNVAVGHTIHELTHNRDLQELSILGALTTDIMREATNADIAFQNSGGIRTTIPAGTITIGNLYEVFPFDSTLFTMEMTGAQIMKVLEYGIPNKQVGMIQFSGLKVISDETQGVEQRLTVTLPNGTPLDLAKSYKVVINDFLAVGGDNFTMFKEGKNSVDTFIPLRDLMATAIKKRKIIDTKLDDRFILNKPAISMKLPIAA